MFLPLAKTWLGLAAHDRLPPIMNRKAASEPPAPAPAGSGAALPARSKRQRKPGPGRPRLAESEARTVSVTLTLTEAEAELARKRAAAAGLRLRPYLRACAGLSGPQGGDPAAPAPSIGAAEVERLALLREAVRQLGKAGSNVNQIAHHANIEAAAGRAVAPALAGSAEALVALRDALAELRLWPGIRVSLPSDRAGSAGPPVRRGGKRRGR